jgi:hypothetical protein
MLYKSQIGALLVASGVTNADYLQLHLVENAVDGVG